MLTCRTATNSGKKQVAVEQLKDMRRHCDQMSNKSYVALFVISQGDNIQYVINNEPNTPFLGQYMVTHSITRLYYVCHKTCIVGYKYFYTNDIICI